MSHFCVLVASYNDDDKTLEKLLQPYHEYECTGIVDQYVVFVDKHDEMVEAWSTDTIIMVKGPDDKIYDSYDSMFYREPTAEEKEKIEVFGSGFNEGLSYYSQNWGDGLGYRPKVHEIPDEFKEVEVPISEKYESIEKYAEEWHGYNIIQNGRIGTLTNPNKKWDWWTIGGRFNGHFRTIDGFNASSVLKSDVDFKRMINDSAEEATCLYDRASFIIGGRSFLSFKECKERTEGIDKAHKLYNDQEVIKDFHKDGNFKFINVDQFLIPRDKYIEKKSIEYVCTFAILYNSKWYENEDESWFDNYFKIIDSIPDDMYLTVVDCHI